MTELQHMLRRQFNKANLASEMSFFRFESIFLHMAKIKTIVDPSVSEMKDINQHGEKILSLMQQALHEGK